MKSEADIRAIHNHVIEGTVRFDSVRNKQICEIQTRGIDGQFDGNTRTLATSDLHQTFWTVETKKTLDKIRAKAKRALKPKVAKVKVEAVSDSEEVVILEDADFAALEDKEARDVEKLKALAAA
jgi:hypothetical protein